jgi:transposase
LVENLKIGLNWGFRLSGIDDSSGVFDGESRVFVARKRGNVKSKPGYRRVRKYYKSPGKYQEERKRRKQVMLLADEGLSTAQIAEKLGVSERTVKRDRAKVKPYVEREFRHALADYSEAKQREIETQLEDLSLSEKLKKMTSIMAERQRQLKLLRKRDYRRHRMLITIDNDKAAQGQPCITCEPNPPLTVGLPLGMAFRLITKGKEQYVGEITLRRHE